MKDARNNELKVGDDVVYTTGHYKQLYFGKIVDITPKTVLIEQTRKTMSGIYLTDKDRVKPRQVAKL